VFCETLEARRLMAFSPFTVGGTLFLVGTAGDEDATVAQTGDGTVSLHDHVSNSTRSFTGVRQLVVMTGGGSNGCRLITRDIPAVLQCGSGDDVFLIHNGALPDPISPAADPIPQENAGAAVVVMTGGGADQVEIYDYGRVGTVALLGDGDDNGRVVFGSLDSARPSTIYGENGNDILAGPGGIVELWDPETEILLERYIDPGIGHARLYGGGGSDTLWSFNSDTWLDGGSGSDTAYLNEDSLALIVGRIENVLAALDAPTP
jgi:hypothetical protein